jgi:hypothetical protein
VILANLHEFTGAAMVADVLTHDLVAILYFVYWLVFVPKSGLARMMPFAWLSYPLAYVGYALVRGASTGRYPYPFLNVTDLGIEAVLFNSLLLAAVFFLIGEAFVGIGMLISRFFPGGSERSQ